MDYVVDLMPTIVRLLDFLVPTIGVLVGIYLVPVLVKYGKKFGIQNEIADNTRLQEFIGRGIAFGFSRMQEILSNRKLEIHTKNQLISTAADYVISSAPGILKKFGVTPERLAEIVEAKLAEMQAKAPETREVP